MHELSIALSMVDMATAEAAHREGRVCALHLKLGPLSGVVKEALTFSYQIACQGTPLEGSQLIVEDVPVVIHCGSCVEDRLIENIQDFRCSHCGSSNTNVVQGRELELVALELEEEALAT
jgi:hydrogenase nickel incorporation protein HypA/HybF